MADAHSGDEFHIVTNSDIFTATEHVAVSYLSFLRRVSKSDTLSQKRSVFEGRHHDCDRAGIADDLGWFLNDAMDVKISNAIWYWSQSICLSYLYVLRKLGLVPADQELPDGMYHTRKEISQIRNKVQSALGTVVPIVNTELLIATQQPNATGIAAEDRVTRNSGQPIIKVCRELGISATIDLYPDKDDDPACMVLTLDGVVFVAHDLRQAKAAVLWLYEVLLSIKAYQQFFEACDQLITLCEARDLRGDDSPETAKRIAEDKESLEQLHQCFGSQASDEEAQSTTSNEFYDLEALRRSCRMTLS